MLCVIEIVGHAVRSRIEGYCVVLKIGIISDTHGLVRPEAEQGLAGVAHIIHAGDIGRADVLVKLRRIAPVTAIRGSVDSGNLAKRYPDTQVVRLGERSFYVLHDLQQLQESIQQFAELTWWFPATRIVRGSKRLTVCST